MTKEQIKKHGKVIKWFCDNPEKGVWVKISNRWEQTIEPAFNPKLIYIQNDEYVELRKALAEGKTVQLDNQFGYDSSKLKSWIKVDEIYNHIPIAHYRVKLNSKNGMKMSKYLDDKEIEDEDN